MAAEPQIFSGAAVVKLKWQPTPLTAGASLRDKKNKGEPRNDATSKRLDVAPVVVGIRSGPWCLDNEYGAWSDKGQ
jgi:hypothetical protein